MRTQSVWSVLVLLALGLTLLSCVEANKNATDGAVAKKDIYIVVFEQMPVVTYNGKIIGLRGTAKYFSEHWRKSHRRYGITHCPPGFSLLEWKALPGWDQISRKNLICTSSANLQRSQEL